MASVNIKNILKLYSVQRDLEAEEFPINPLSF